MAKTIGIILVIVGIIMLVWTGFSFTKKEKVGIAIVYWRLFSFRLRLIAFLSSGFF